MAQKDVTNLFHEGCIRARPAVCGIENYQFQAVWEGTGAARPTLRPGSEQMFAGALALPNSAAAVEVQCPNPSTGFSTVYFAEGTGNTTVLECTFGDGNLNGAGNDAFLALDDEDSFGGGWTSFCSTDGGGCQEVYDFEFTDGTWSFTGVAGEQYVLGIKDGTDPAWAAFLLDIDPDGNYAGTWEITKNGKTDFGALSHFVLYDREVETTTTPTTPSETVTTPTSSTPGPVVPEPTLLTLLGGGLVVAARRMRRKK